MAWHMPVVMSPQKIRPNSSNIWLLSLEEIVGVKRHWIGEYFLLLPLILHQWFLINLSFTIVEKSRQKLRSSQSSCRILLRATLSSPACYSASVRANPLELWQEPDQEYKLISFKRDRSFGLQIPNIYQDHFLSCSQFEIIWLLRNLPLNDQWNSNFSNQSGVIPGFHGLLKEFWPTQESSQLLYFPSRNRRLVVI